jgi:hypothetical protein
VPDSDRAIAIYVDADACPVKAEVYAVAERHSVRVFVVANSFLNVPRDALIERVVVGSGFDAADDWIAERARRGTIVVTADVPLASRVREGGRGRHRTDGTAVQRGLDRHGARHPPTCSMTCAPAARSPAVRSRFRSGTARPSAPPSTSPSCA